MAGKTETPVARRVQRPGWRDPRLGVGVLLVASSVALGAWTLGEGDGGVPVYVARDVLTPGEPLTLDALVVVSAAVPERGVYLQADEPLPVDAVVTRLVGSGEIVPAAAVGSATDVAVRPVSVAVGGSLSSSVVAGALVDLWLTVAPPATAGTSTEPAEPVLVAGALRVAGVEDDDSLFAGAQRTAVEVLVPEDGLKPVLGALAGEGELTLVPLPGRS